MVHFRDGIGSGFLTRDPTWPKWLLTQSPDPTRPDLVIECLPGQPVAMTGGEGRRAVAPPSFSLSENYLLVAKIFLEKVSTGGEFSP